MSDDPFAPEAPATDPWAESTSSTTVQEAPVSVPSESEISVTLKQHSGHNAPWIVVRAATAEEVKNQLRDVVNADLLRAVTITAAKFSGLTPSTPNASSAPTQQFQGQPSQPQQQYQQQPKAQAASQLPPGIEQKYCQHGPMVYKTGVNKWDKPYQAFFCPTDKDDPSKCRGIFL